MSNRTHPAVEVTLAGCATNVPPTVWVSYVEAVTIKGNLFVKDEYGMSLRVSPEAVRPLGYSATFGIVAGKLVAQ